MIRVLCILLWVPSLADARLSGSPEEVLASCQADRSRLEARIQELEALSDASYITYLSQGVGSFLKIPPSDPAFFSICAMVFFVILTQSLANGLTMGLVSLDPIELAMIAKKQDEDLLDPKDRKQLRDDQEAATRVLPLIHDHHLLMVTVLLVNCLCGEVLPLFLDRLVPSWLSLVLSVTLVLMFSEVIPSAIFTGAKQLMLAARFSPLVVVWRFCFFPIAWPIARLLDCILGVEHKGRYNFAELKALVAMHAKDQIGGEDEAIFKVYDPSGMGIITTEKPHKFTSESAVIFTGSEEFPAVSKKLEEDQVYYVKKCAPLRGRDLDCTFQLYKSENRRDLISYEGPEDLVSGIFRLQERDEIKIAQGAMLLSHATVQEHMQLDEAVTLDKAFMLESSQSLDPETLKDIDKHGFSRILVYEGNKHNVRGYILTKQLITIYAHGEYGSGKYAKVSDVDVRPLIVVPGELKMLDLLNKFQEQKIHIALVTNSAIGVKDAWEHKKPVPPHVHMWGILTLEDVIERLLQEKIDDEYDEAQFGVLGRSGPRIRQSNAPHAKAVFRNARSHSWTGDSTRNLEEPLLP